jgi:hypothetical protein
VEDQIVKRRVLVLAGPTEIKPDGLEDGPGRTIDNGALVINFGEPTVTQKQRSPKQKQQ